MIRIGKLQIKRDYVALIIFTIVQSIISWWAALDYGRSFQTATFSAAQLPLIGYTLAVSAAIFIILDRRIAPQWSLIAIGITVAFAFTNIIAKESELLYLLLTCSAWLLIMAVPRFGMQNYFGLVVFSVIMTFTIPVAVFDLQNNYLSTTFLWKLTPMLASYVFLYVPSFSHQRQINQLISAITGLLLVIAIFLQPLTWQTILAILITIAVWFSQQSFGRTRLHLMINVAIQLVLIFLLYWCLVSTTNKTTPSYASCTLACQGSRFIGFCVSSLKWLHCFSHRRNISGSGPATATNDLSTCC